MNEFISLLLITLILILFDSVWFSFSLANIYEPTFTAIQGSPLQFRVAGGIVAWFLLAIGVRYFALEQGGSAFTRGALLGLVIYGIYNGTNYATFKNYSLNTAIADTLWGVFAVGTVSAIAAQCI